MKLKIIRKNDTFQNFNLYIDENLITDENIELDSGVHSMAIEQLPLTEHEYFLYKESIIDNTPIPDRRLTNENKQYYLNKYTINFEINKDSYFNVKITPQNTSADSKDCFNIDINSDLKYEILSKEHIKEEHSRKNEKIRNIIIYSIAGAFFLFLIYQFISVII